MKLLESGEMYLETILILSQTKDGVHAIDLAEYMNFSKPSVSRALSNLKEGGYCIVDEMDHIRLTKTGRAIAEKIYERHRVLTECLTRLGVDEKQAVADACKIEHDISDATFEALKKHLGKLTDTPQ